MIPLLSLKHVSKTFGHGENMVHAVRNVSFDVFEGECVAMVGESGSGKTTLANIILGLFGQTDGALDFAGQRLTLRRSLEQRSAIQFVQQNPLSSLNPKRSIGASVRLGLDVYHIGKRSDRWIMVEDALEDVGLPRTFRKRLPSALSGGQCQRVAIARALACQSRLVILDEPTSALDVLVQARVLHLLNDLRAEKNLSYIFITHDLSLVRNIADRVAVFKAGQLIDCADTATIFNNPRTQYTRELIGAVPVITREEIALKEALVRDGPK